MNNDNSELTNEEKEKKKKKYYPELDCIRGLAIFFLLCYHTDIGTYLDLGILPAQFFERLVFSLGVPVFFFLSAVGLTIKYQNVEKFPLRKFYKRRYSYLVPLYLLWSFIIILLVEMSEIILSEGFQLSVLLNPDFLLNFGINYLVGVATGHVYTLWFVFVLFFYYLIFPLLFLVMKNADLPTQKIIVFIVITLTGLTYFLADTIYTFFFLKDIFVVYTYSTSTINLVVDFGFFFRFIPHFVNFLLGIYVGLNYESIKNSLQSNGLYKILIPTFACFFFFIYSFIFTDFGSTNNIFLILGTNSLSLLLFVHVKNWGEIIDLNQEEINNNKFSIKNKFIKFWWSTGQNSTGIYFSHRAIMAPVWFGIYVIFGIAMWNDLGGSIPRYEAFLFAAMVLTLTYVGCIIFIQIAKKLPYNKYIIGKSG